MGLCLCLPYQTEAVEIDDNPFLGLSYTTTPSRSCYIYGCVNRIQFTCANCDGKLCKPHYLETRYTTRGNLSNIIYCTLCDQLIFEYSDWTAR